MDRQVTTDISSIGPGRYRVEIIVCEEGSVVAERRIEIGNEKDHGYSAVAAMRYRWLDDMREVGPDYSWEDWAHARLPPRLVELLAKVNGTTPQQILERHQNRLMAVDLDRNDERVA